MTTARGTVKHEYDKQWIYLNPSPSIGPFAWNVANIPDYSIIEKIAELYTIPPIMNNQTDDIANLFFSIKDCKGRDEVESAIVVSQLKEKLTLPFESTDNITILESDKPVRARQDGEDAYLWFEIRTLNWVDDIVNSEAEASGGYNNRRVTSLTADTPLYVDALDSRATVTFNITTLPDA